MCDCVVWVVAPLFVFSCRVCVCFYYMYVMLRLFCLCLYCFVLRAMLLCFVRCMFRVCVAYDRVVGCGVRCVCGCVVCACVRFVLFCLYLCVLCVVRVCVVLFGVFTLRCVVALYRCVALHFSVP